jgi:hypothetical protein
MRSLFLLLVMLTLLSGRAQLLVGNDTISVIENNYCLKMPWAGGINAPTFSNADVNYDGKNDLVIYDKMNNSALGAFKCFINVGNSGQAKYKYAPQLTLKFPHTYNWALMTDYNADGKADLFISVTGGIQVWKNIGNASTGLDFQLIYGILNSDYNPGGSPTISNIYSGPVGIPGIADVDGDGDFDILTFSATGIFIEWHKNKAKELALPNDSMRFELADPCWGNMSESSCVVSLGACPPKAPGGTNTFVPSANKVQHAGAGLMCFDRDGDGDQDLILSDISCSTIEFCQNDGTLTDANVTDTTKLFPNYPNKASTTPIQFNSFPTTYYVDTDGDGKKELIAAPNTFGSENANSVWLYKNTSTTPTVNFQFVKKNFLQDEMIEAGQMSRPFLLDVDADGKKDLIVGGGGIYQNNARRPRFFYYRNTGTLTQPSFSLVTKDYASLSTLLSSSMICIYAAPGDIDADGDQDLVVVINSNILSWIENTAGPGNPCNFSVYKHNPWSINFPSSDATPQLFDYDKDGKLDLMVGTKNGKVYYYHNNGTATVPSFTLVNGSFPNVSLKGDFFVYGLDGFGSPFFYDEAAQTKLLGGCVTGQLYYFDVPSVVTNPCVLIDSTANGILEATFSAPWFEDINGDGKRDLFVGSAGGGVSFYSSKAPDVGLGEHLIIDPHAFYIYPNPVNDKLTIECKESGAMIREIDLVNILGERLIHEKLNVQTTQVDLGGLSEGVYFVITTREVNGQLFTSTDKIVKR